MSYDLFHVWWKQFRELWFTYEKKDVDLWPTTLAFNSVLEIVKIHVHTKFHQAECCGLCVIVSTTFLPYLAMVKKSENPVLWPWPLTYDHEILWVSCSCRSFVQNFIELRAAVHELSCIRYGEKTTKKQYRPSLWNTMCNVGPGPGYVCDMRILHNIT